MKTRYLIFSVCVFLVIFSCQEDMNIENINTVDQKEMDNITIDESNIAFAEILAKAMINKDIRDFIKNEAMLQISNDYDVIYHYVKDFKLGDGKSFRESLAKYCSNISYLDALTNSDLTLSILVPDLSDEFSADKWNTDQQVPIVAYRNSNIDKSTVKLKAFDVHGNAFEIERYIYPTAPTIVVKSNERLATQPHKNITTMSMKLFTQPSSTASLTNQEGIFAYFIDDVFDNLSQEKSIVESITESSSESFTSASINREVYYNNWKDVDRSTMSL